jgi:lysophospholipase L1-like esterase
MCPPSQSAEVMAVPAMVTYPPPTVVGGAAPVTIDCSPTSGSSFPAGSTNVSCIAVDVQRRSDSCALTVTVTERLPVVRLTAARFVAFGDSVTEGKLGPAEYTGDPRFPDAYALVLYNLLTERYTAQTIDMFDRGFGGERVVPDGVARLPGVLSADAPQVLLLLEGVNDLISGGSIASVVDGLRRMIREARSRGIVVFLGTLLPERPGGLRAGHPELIAPANDEIRRLADAEGATLVDLYQAFGGSPDPLIDADGLHPTAAGYKRMGETFFSAIRSRLEVTETLSTSHGSVSH